MNLDTLHTYLQYKSVYLSLTGVKVVPCMMSFFCYMYMYVPLQLGTPPHPHRYRDGWRVNMGGGV